MSNEIEKVRGILLTLIRRHRPHVKWTRKAPTVWQPTTVIDPRPNQIHRNFTELTCWEYIEELLASGHEIEIVNMRKPPGSKGYVMKVEQGPNNPKLYIKLQIGQKEVIGRSFHYDRIRYR